MMESMTITPTPLVSREARLAFTQRLVECYPPQKGSCTPMEQPFGGLQLAKIHEMRRLCPVRFPLDLLVRRPEEVEVRYRGGDPVMREGLDQGEMLHG